MTHSLLFLLGIYMNLIFGVSSDDYCLKSESLLMEYNFQQMIFSEEMNAEEYLCAKDQGCNFTNFERCVLRDNKQPDLFYCDCLRGFARESKNRTCYPLAIYVVTLRLDLDFDSEFFNTSSTNYNILQQNVKLLIHNGLQYTQLGVYLLNTILLSVRSDITIETNINFRKVSQFDKLNVTDTALQKCLKIGIDYALAQNESLIPLNEDKPNSITVKHFDNCKKAANNYCHRNAECKVVNNFFQCNCKSGFEDQSMSNVTTGERCIESCSKFGCAHGECHIKDSRFRYCKCDYLFTGDKCDRTELAMILPGVFILMIVAAIFSLTVYRRLERRKQLSPGMQMVNVVENGTSKKQLQVNIVDNNANTKSKLEMKEKEPNGSKINTKSKLEIEKKVIDDSKINTKSKLEIEKKVIDDSKINVIPKLQLEAKESFT